MGNQHVAPQDRPGALTTEAIKARRREVVGGLSRRQLLRRSLGLGVAIWLVDSVAGTLGFIWPNLTGGFGGRVTIGPIATAIANPAVHDPGGEFQAGAPAYFEAAKSYVVLLDPSRGYVPGDDPTGDGISTNVRTLYQRCTHLGCKPNFCVRNFWFECPCHGSRYDRLGIKAANLGPAPRGLDRFASSVDGAGVLTIDTSRITLGPLPVALGQPGLIPPRSPTGCL
jgi:cytochrome b6-f complex iron-sulfur subunit